MRTLILDSSTFEDFNPEPVFGEILRNVAELGGLEELEALERATLWAQASFSQYRTRYDDNVNNSWYKLHGYLYGALRHVRMRAKGY